MICPSLSSHSPFQLWSMRLTEVPSELFRKKNLKQLWLDNNNLCSLPSEIAHLTTLEQLFVRLSERLDRDLTESHVVSGLQQPAYVSSARTRSADQSQDAQRAALEADGSCSDPAWCAFRPTTTSSRRSLQKSASWRSSSGSLCDCRSDWTVI